MSRNGIDTHFSKVNNPGEYPVKKIRARLPEHGPHLFSAVENSKLAEQSPTRLESILRFPVSRDRVRFSATSTKIRIETDDNKWGFFEMLKMFSEYCVDVLRMFMGWPLLLLLGFIFQHQIAQKIGEFISVIASFIPSTHINWMGIGHAVASGGIAATPWVLALMAMAAVILYIGYRVSKPKPASIWQPSNRR